MSKYRRKHNPTVAHGRYLQPADLERLLHGVPTPEAEFCAAKPGYMSEGAKEALRLMEQGKAALAQQRAGQA